MTLNIRKAVKGDEETVLGFIKELADFEKLGHEVVATPGKIRNTLFCEQPKVFSIIAENDGAPCGFALYFINYSTFLGKHGLYLEDLYVRQSERGSGIGKALLARLAQIAQDNDCGRMEWWVLDWNKPAIEFYQSIGAEAMDDWTVFRLTGDSLSSLANEAGTDE